MYYRWKRDTWRAIHNLAFLLPFPDYLSKALLLIQKKITNPTTNTPAIIPTIRGLFLCISGVKCTVIDCPRADTTDIIASHLAFVNSLATFSPRIPKILGPSCSVLPSLPGRSISGQSPLVIFLWGSACFLWCGCDLTYVPYTGGSYVMLWKRLSRMLSEWYVKTAVKVKIKNRLYINAGIGTGYIQERSGFKSQ